MKFQTASEKKKIIMRGFKIRDEKFKAEREREGARSASRAFTLYTSAVNPETAYSGNGRILFPLLFEWLIKSEILCRA